MHRSVRSLFTYALCCVSTLSACSQLPTAAPQAEIATPLPALHAAKAAGRVGTITGYLYLMLPSVPTPLHGLAVTLVPLAPDQEAMIHQMHDRYLASGRAPLAAEQLQQARQLLEPRVGGELAQTIATGTEEPDFTFADIPEGRWLLLAELPSKVSTLLWAVPITVSAGAITRQSLNDTNIWLEGLTP